MSETKAGIWDLASADYHADAIADAQPSLSASIASILCSQSPAHARAAHPRLNPDFKRDHDEKFDRGNACHALILEGRNGVAIIDAKDWRTDAAKLLRDQARTEGRIPLLSKEWEVVCEMEDAVREQLAVHAAEPPLFTDGKPEQTLVWMDGDVLCRARLDWLRDDLATIDDLKTTARSADPEAYSRALFKVGGDVQAAFYLRGLKALTGYDAEFRWCVVESSPPYAVSVISPAPDVLALGDSKVKYALEVWKRCLAADSWPGYSDRVGYAELPAWEDTRWLEKIQREGVAA